MRLRVRRGKAESDFRVRLASKDLVVILLDSWGKNSRIGDAQRIKQWMEGPEPAPRRKRRRG